MSQRLPGELLSVAEAVNPEMPSLWWAVIGDVRLAGMAAPPPGLSFHLLKEYGFDVIVSLAGPARYDPAPLIGYAFDLQDLANGAEPVDAGAEAAEVGRAVVLVSDLLAEGRGVAVHCKMGIGRTGLVIGAVLVAAGFSSADVGTWLDEVQRARGVKGWPESPWQSATLDTFADNC